MKRIYDLGSGNAGDSGFCYHNGCCLSHGTGFIQTKTADGHRLGYIAAGMIIGPYTPPFSFILHPEILNLLAEIGIVLLQFVVGLEYPIAKLRSVGRKALVIAFSEAFGTFGLGFAIGQIMGLALFNSLFIALVISVTSTVVLSRVLQELGIAKTDISSLLLGVTVIEAIIS